jgi:hypothetical protein
VKRSASIRLLLLGGVSAGTLAGCVPGNGQKPFLSQENVYTNNFYLAGVGYYHAPFRAWYALPYNHFDLQNQRYYYGGQWAATPHRSITNISAPTLEAVQRAEVQRTDVRRGGFGSTSHSYWAHS